jgi:hypothetical protein
MLADARPACGRMPRVDKESNMEFQPGTAVHPATDERIDWFEKTYRVSLPQAFVQMLKHSNGAIPMTNLFDEGGTERMIERMLCLIDQPRQQPTMGIYDITTVLTQLDARLIDDEQLVGMNVIPIASLFGGDFICLDYRENGAAPIVSVWDHERSAEFRPFLVKIADSFEEFTRLLRR